MWVILNANLLQWGDEFYASKAEAAKELRDFFRGVSGVNFSKFHVLSVDNLPEGARLKTSKQTHTTEPTNDLHNRNDLLHPR